MSEMRLINVNALLSQAFTTMAGYDAVLVDDIVKAPTVDAVPVVRCKDCEWWTKQKGSAQGRCAKLEIYPTGAWFCANGKKRGADDA